MRIIYTIVVVCLCVLQLEAQSVWTGNVDSDWSNSGNWSPGLPTTGGTATIPGTPQGGNFPVYVGSPTIDYTIQNFGTITFNTFIYNLGTIVNFSDGNIVNDGYFVNAGMIMFDNDGDFDNNGTFDNYGTFDNGGPGSNPANFNNINGSVLNNYGTFKNTAILNNDGTINNFGSLRSTNTLNNNGSVVNKGDMTNPSGSTFNNNASSTFYNEAGASFATNGVFNNQTNFTNEGLFALQSSVDFQNNATITNNENFVIGGELQNINSFVNNDLATVTNSGNLNNTGSFQNNGTIETDVCGIITQNSSTNITGTVLHDGTLYEIQGTVNVTILEFGVTLYDINETKPPVAGCKAGLFLQLDENGNATLTADEYDKGSYGSCGATIASRSISQSNFTAADLGSKTVSLTVTDNLGMSSTCDNVITVISYVAPIVEIDDPDVNFNCPPDVTVTTIPGASSAAVNWTEPTGTSNCAPMPMDCSNPPSIDGMMYLGTIGNSFYYKKTGGDLTYADAKTFVENRGGTLPVISDQAENDFVMSFLNGGNAWLALTDENSEGNFEWTNGEALSYTNWNTNEPNNYNNNEDHTEMLANGRWNDIVATAHKWVIMELACPSSSGVDCSAVPETIPNTIFLGEYNNSKYYCSTTNNYTWAQAKSWAQQNGGHLVSVNSAGENNFIQNTVLANTVWLGYNDAATEGVWVWDNGDADNYTNWLSGEPNDNGPGGSGTAEYAVLVKSDGLWRDRNGADHYEAIMEIPCPTNAPPQTCSLEDHGASDNGIGTRTVWMNFNNLSTNREYSVDANGASFQEFANGTALLSGTVERVDDPSYKYTFSVNLINKRNWYEWSALGRTYKPNNNVASDHTAWTYYEVDNSNSTFTGAGANAGKVLQITHDPSDYTYGFQIGDGANLKDGDFGISGWFAFSGDENGHGDFNGDLNNCGASSTAITVNQITGPANGANFPVGNVEVAYEVTDGCGNTEICTFNVTVQPTPTTITVNCPNDIVVDAAPGASSAIVNYAAPTGSSNCFSNSAVEVALVDGFDSGSEFPVGVTGVSYSFVDSCNNVATCFFNVTVNPVATLLTVADCSADISVSAPIGQTSTVVTWTTPTASTNCFTNNTVINQIQGPASGSSFSIGATPIAYLIADDCGNTEICYFIVNVAESCPAAGTACDDGDASTENDVEDGNCNCAGTPCPTAGTACDDGDASTENDVEDGNCNCAGTPCPTAGTACDDGDASTENDVEDGNCNCAGTPCPTAGTACDDGDASTENDVEDGNCNCAGTPCPTAGTACDDGDASTENDIEDGNCNCAGTPCPTAGTACDDGDASTENDIEDGNCNCAGTPCPTAGTACDDGDASTENDVEDGNCNCAGTPCPTAGTACDDGDASTENDVEDGNCNCAGTPCPTAGTACDDGDADTENDIEDGNCNCAGTPIVCPPAGTACDDGDASTENDVEDGNCNCAGTPCPTAGTACDDGDASTENDVEDGNCNCAGTPCPTAGTACDDGDASTENDVEDGNCNCAGTPCLTAGTACDDGDASTENDVEDGNCNCAGTPCPTAGTACDDGDANTENDVEDGNCNCAGTPVNSGCTNPTNLALNGSASQSSIQQGAVASRANDGNTSGNFWGQMSVALTNWEAQPWWEVDLGEVSTIQEINVYNRTDCCDQFLKNYYILVSDHPFGTDDLNTLLAQSDVESFFQSEVAGSPTMVDINTTGRYVRVQLSGAAFLALAEVEVMGCTGGAPCAPAGTTCDDGDANTENDVEDGNCNCAGTPIPCPPAGTTCDDGDANTENDVEDGNCNCAGTPIPCPPAGTTCDDGDANTENDVEDGNCNCAGTPIPCPPAGTTCDDGDANTENDVEDGNCNCAGTPIPCPPAGTTCDDGDANTENDVEDGNCNCAGTPIPCPPAGTVCDDGDANTENDVEDGNCNCAGTPIPCPPAGTTCDDGDANTENDVEDGNCNCAGTPIAGTCTNPSNLALDGTASQSSTQHGAVASRANDGNTSGNFWGQMSVAFTNWENQPWWEVDLGELSTIQTVNVYNRTDCCDQFLKNYYILVSENPFGGDDLNTLLSRPDVESYFEATVAGSPSTIDINTTGRYVRVQLSGSSFLALAEVEVMGCLGGGSCAPAGTACDDGDANTENDVEDGNCNCAGTPIPCAPAGTACDDGDANTENDVEDGNCNCAGTPIPCPPAGTACDDGNANTENDVEDGNCNCAGTPIPGSCTNPSNLALGGTATQSSTQQGADASRANDGNTNGNFWGQMSVSLTNWEKYAWWEIDLGELADIQDINIWNRTDCCNQFLNDYSIYVSDVPFTDVVPALTEAQAGVSTYHQSEVAATPSRISIGRTGRYVRVQLMGTSFLALAEVEIMGCPVQIAPAASSSNDQLIFKAFKDARTAKLQWITNTDYKNDYFVIEHSLDGERFEELMNSMSTSDSEAPSYYQEIDMEPAYGVNFYRLKQVFFDGSFVYSDIKQLDFEIDLNAFSVFPNPTDNELFINLKAFAGKSGRIEVYNALGQPLYQQDFDAIPENPVYLDTRSYKNGFYNITVKAEGHPRMTKIFVVNKL